MVSGHGASRTPPVAAESEAHGDGIPRDMSQTTDLAGEPSTGEGELQAAAQRLEARTETAVGVAQPLTQPAAGPPNGGTAAAADASEAKLSPAPVEALAQQPQVRVRLRKTIVWQPRKPPPRRCNTRAPQRPYPTGFNELEVGDRLMVRFKEDGRYHWHFGAVAKLHTASVVWRWDANGGGEEWETTLPLRDFGEIWRIPELIIGPLPPPGSFLTADFVTVVPGFQEEFLREEEQRCGVRCIVCQSRASGSRMVICETEGCDAPCHIWCMDPPMADLPPEDEPWLCPQCTSEGRQVQPSKAHSAKQKSKGEEAPAKHPPPVGGSAPAAVKRKLKRPKEESEDEEKHTAKDSSGSTSDLKEWLKKQRVGRSSSSSESFEVRPRPKKQKKESKAKREAAEKKQRRSQRRPPRAPTKAEEEEGRMPKRRRCKGRDLDQDATDDQPRDGMVATTSDKAQAEPPKAAEAPEKPAPSPAPLPATVATPPSVAFLSGLATAVPTSPGAAAGGGGAAAVSETVAVGTDHTVDRPPEFQAEATAAAATAAAAPTGPPDRPPGSGLGRQSPGPSPGTGPTARHPSTSLSSSSSRVSSSSSSSSTSLSSLESGAVAHLQPPTAPAPPAAVGPTPGPPPKRPAAAPVKAVDPKPRSNGVRAPLVSPRPAAAAPPRPPSGFPKPKPSPAAPAAAAAASAKVINVDGMGRPKVRQRKGAGRPVWSLMGGAETRLTSDSLEPLSVCTTLDKNKRVRVWMQDLFFDGSDPSSLIALD